MRLILTLALTATLGLSAAPSLMAQNANANERAQQNRTDRDTRTETRGRQSANDRPARAAGQDRPARQDQETRNGGWTYGQVISSLRNGRSGDIREAIGTADRVGMLSLSTLGPAAANAAALGNALAAEGQTTDEVQAAIAATPLLADSIAAAGIDASEVIGFTYDAGGTLLLIVDDLD